MELWVPKGHADNPVNVLEIGGTTGIPKSRIAMQDFLTAYALLSDTSPDEYFPRCSNRLMLGPSKTRGGGDGKVLLYTSFQPVTLRSMLAGSRSFIDQLHWYCDSPMSGSIF
ncbi:hypothetical protein Pr1d_01110 [Bythopirellula goksoeyrii]|uniref:Uncharacterized protein n=1 Tax=Bythopirellula goksoeyrii TaxID=1400387 RepID=A0A5B9Q537_9BACT|nr:hypothetical protein Pr1d_01110 [Bythopirellula goksoeyrii]